MFSNLVAIANLLMFHNVYFGGHKVKDDCLGDLESFFRLGLKRQDGRVFQYAAGSPS